jgi:hypothetical protein
MNAPVTATVELIVLVSLGDIKLMKKHNLVAKGAKANIAVLILISIFALIFANTHEVILSLFP